MYIALVVAIGHDGQPYFYGAYGGGFLWFLHVVEVVNCPS